VDEDLDAVFKALADRSRRLVLDKLRREPGQTLTELCGGLDMTRQAVSKHLAILAAADLVVAVRRGREKLHYLNPIPINQIHQRWISKYERSRLDALATLKTALEERRDD
jgi:DNA-binding transcriptional ArsR family regulator